jgi:hypothetical protein
MSTVRLLHRQFYITDSQSFEQKECNTKRKEEEKRICCFITARNVSCMYMYEINEEQRI